MIRLISPVRPERSPRAVRFGRVVEGGDGVEDALLGRRPDVRVVVEDVRDGLDRHLGEPRDVVDGGRHGSPCDGRSQDSITLYTVFARVWSRCGRAAARAAAA